MALCQTLAVKCELHGVGRVRGKQSVDVFGVVRIELGLNDAAGEFDLS